MSTEANVDSAAPAPWNAAKLTRSIDASVSHACLSNLVIYTDDMSHEAVLTEAMGEYVVKHPCRIILLLARPRSAESKIEATVSLHTYSSGGAKNVACEQITLRASGASVKELASAVQPLLVPDLPIHLWWRGVFLTQRQLVDQFLSFVDRFIYDGVGWSDLHYTVTQVADFIERYNEKVGFTNFNWARLRPWRESTADFFDAGLFENEIWDIHHLRVEFMAAPETEEGQQFRALLYVSWLAVQLEWTPERGIPGTDYAQLQFTSKKGASIDVEIVMLPQTTAGGRGLQKVILSAGKDGVIREFIIKRDHEQQLMVMAVNKDGAQTVIRKVPHTESSDADLLYRELGRRVRNRVFEKTFKMAAIGLQMM
jgi:glucose-6-phosphate dehydrogenase assembly protein OpcA